MPCCVLLSLGDGDGLTHSLLASRLTPLRRLLVVAYWAEAGGWGQSKTQKAAKAPNPRSRPIPMRFDATTPVDRSRGFLAVCPLLVWRLAVADEACIMPSCLKEEEAMMLALDADGQGGGQGTSGYPSLRSNDRLSSCHHPPTRARTYSRRRGERGSRAQPASQTESKGPAGAARTIPC